MLVEVADIYICHFIQGFGHAHVARKVRLFSGAS